MADLLDPADLEYVTELIERISKDVDRITVQITGAGEKVTQAVEKTTNTVDKKTVKTFDLIDNKYKQFERDSIKRIHLFGDEWEKTLDRVEKKWKEYGAEVKRHMTEARGPLGAGGSATGLTSVYGAIGNLKGQMFGNMPFGLGGILGLALWGAKREEEFSAAARRAMFQLQAVGGAGSQHLGKLTGQIRTMYQAWGSMGEELDATLGAFAQFNIGEEAFDRASISAAGFMKNIAGIATAVDLLNAAAPGTTARLIGETMQNASLSIKEASDQVINLASHLREAKLNYAQFGAGIVQATSALRIQGQSLKDTEQVFFRLNQSFQAQGMSKQRAAQAALTGTQAATGAIGGLSQGLQGFIGQRLSARGVEGFAGMRDPFALMVKMQEGLTKGGSFAQPVFEELKKIAVKAAGTGGNPEEKRMRQIGVLQSLGVNNFEAARAIIDGADASAHLLDPATKTAKFTQELQQSFSTYSNRQSAYEREMRTIQDEIAQIGGDILTVLSTSFRLLPIMFEKLALDIKQATSVTGLSAPEQLRYRALSRASTAFSNSVVNAEDGILEHLGKIVKTAGGSISRTTMRGNVKQIMADLKSTEGYGPSGIDPNETAAVPFKMTNKLNLRQTKAGPGDNLRAAAAANREAADHLDHAAKHAEANKPKAPRKSAPRTAPKGTR